MATKDEIKSLLEAEIGPLKAKLTSIEKSFSELEKSVKHFSAKYDELLKQVQRSNDRTASLSTDVKNLKEDMKQCKKIGREIERPFSILAPRLLGADRRFTNRRSILF